MPFPAGHRLGHYEVVAPIGAGGMGEVYKGRDTRLGRTVAIKVIKGPFTDRFQREAKAISALNHPNICTLFDVGTEDGVSYLVMEYLEGETLAARITKGALPLAEALRWAAQIASALDEAHRNKLTHRDLKPANVVLTRAGAKLVDFGLAKPIAQAVAQGDETQTLPMEDALTARNAVIGTPQYMAPEQIEGKDADGRTDLFALGLVLYEMLAGRRAFDGPNATTIMAGILNTDAPAVTGVPAPVDSLVRRALARNADERWQSARDMQWALENAGAAQPVPVRGESGVWKVVAAVAIFGAVAMGAYALWPRTVPEVPSVRFEIGNVGRRPAKVSPDGTMIAYRENVDGPARIMIRRLAPGDSQVLEGTMRGQPTAWSPDNRWLLFSDEGKLKRIPAVGGAVEMVAEDASTAATASWGSQGSILFVGRGGRLFRVSASGGPVTEVTVRGPGVPALLDNPHFLPDGNRFLARGVQGEGLFLASLASGQGQKVAEGRFNNLAYAGEHVFYSIGGGETIQFVAHRLIGDATAFEGEPVRLGSLPACTVSETGVLVCGTGSIREQLAMVDRAGRRLKAFDPPGPLFGHLDLSPDGKRIAADSNGDIWVLDLDRGIPTRVTFDAGTASSPAWSPDGKTIYYDNGQALYSVPADGTGRPALVSRTPAHHAQSSTDGKRLVFQITAGSGRTGLSLGWLATSQPEKVSPAIAGNPAEAGEPQWSPDDRWLAYQSDESGRREVFVQSFPPGNGKWQVSTTGGTNPRWRGDGRELYYRAPGRRIMAVPVTAREGTFEFGTPAALFEMGPSAGGAAAIRFAVSADGQRFFYNTSNGTPQRRLIVTTNWKAAVRK